MKDGSYYVIQSFMVNELKLKGNELLVYAIIYGFSQDGNSTFKGSLKYLSESTNLSKSTLQDVLKKLLDKNLIIKNDIPQNGFKICEYYANLDSISEIGTLYRNSSQGMPKTVQECTENQHGGIPKIGNNNIINNIDNNIDNKKGANAPNPLIDKTQTIEETAKPKSKKETIFEDFANGNTQLLQALKDFEDSRNKNRSKMTECAKKLLISELQKLSNNPIDWIAMLNQSVLNGWKSVYPLKNNGYNQSVGVNQDRSFPTNSVENDMSKWGF